MESAKLSVGLWPLEFSMRRRHRKSFQPLPGIFSHGYAKTFAEIAPFIGRVGGSSVIDRGGPVARPSAAYE